VGILAVALWVVAIVILEGSTDAPDERAPAAEYLQYYSDDETPLLVGGFIFMLGAVVFLWFLALLRARLGPAGATAAAAFAGGIAASVCLLLLPGAEMAAAISVGEDHDVGAEAAQALHSIPDMFFIGAELSLAVLVAAVGVASVRTRVLPRWFGWVSLLLALVLLIVPIGWAGMLFAFPLWTIVVSVLLVLRPGQPAAAPEPSARAA
jgi:hypothetical protein